MAESPQEASWPVLGLLLPHSSLLVRVISFVCLALGTVFILPLVCLLTYDLCLWIWRHGSSLFAAEAGHESLAPAPASFDPSSSSSSSAATKATGAHGQGSKPARKR